tara:strand:- start:112 stop:438 length:327 start_codon:yes stop_codon:yes gene_type:complete
MENKMSEIKFTEDELTSLREIQSSYREIQMKFGALSMQKLAHEKQGDQIAESEEALMTELEGLQGNERAVAEDLNKKYGAGSLDPQTGVFTPTADPVSAPSDSSEQSE